MLLMFAKSLKIQTVNKGYRHKVEFQTAKLACCNKWQKDFLN